MEDEPRSKTLLERVLQTPISRRNALIGAGVGAASLTFAVYVLERLTSTTPPEMHALTKEQQQQMQQLFTDCFKGLKESYLVDAGGGALRTIYDPEKQNTDAEVQAYSMLSAVHAGDHETLDRLWTYQKRYRNNVGTISWLMDSNGNVAGADSAFDSTQDTAAALVLAHRKGWKGGYADEAKSLLQSSMKAEIEPATYIPRGGSYGGGSEATDPSYYDPYAYEELFAGYDKKWLQVAEACRNVMDKTAERIKRGEIKSYPDWVDASGQPVAGVEKTPQIGYDSTRVSLRQLQAARLLRGASKQHALKQLGLYNTFYEGIVSNGGGYDIGRIVDGYTIAGKPTGHNTYTCFASAAVAASFASEDAGYRNYMLSQLPSLRAQYPFNFYMLLNALRVMS